MNVEERISLEIVELEDKLSQCFEDDRLENVAHYESEIEIPNKKLTHLQNDTRKATNKRVNATIDWRSWELFS